MARDYVYVILWDGWNYICTVDSYQYAKEINSNSVFPTMREIKKIELKNQGKLKNIFVVVDNYGEFFKLFEDNEMAEEYTSINKLTKCNIIKDEVRRNKNIKTSKREPLCTIGDIMNKRGGKYS